MIDRLTPSQAKLAAAALACGAVVTFDPEARTLRAVRATPDARRHGGRRVLASVLVTADGWAFDERVDLSVRRAMRAADAIALLLSAS